MLCFCMVSPDICSHQQLRCVLCVLLFACVWAPPSLTSVLPRVQPEFSRPSTTHLMCVWGRGGGGGEQNLSRLESPQKPLTDSQSYDSEEEQLACVCSSVRLDLSVVGLCGPATQVQRWSFCTVGALGCQCYCCPWRSAQLLLHTGEGRAEQWWTHFFPLVLGWY